MLRKKKIEKKTEGVAEIIPASTPQLVSSRRNSIKVLPLVGFVLILLFALLLHVLSPTPDTTQNTASVVTPEVVPVSGSESVPDLP